MPNKNPMRFEYNGEMLTIVELMKFCVVTTSSLRERLNRGWDIESALFKPARAK